MTIPTIGNPSFRVAGRLRNSDRITVLSLAPGLYASGTFTTHRQILLDGPLEVDAECHKIRRSLGGPNAKVTPPLYAGDARPRLPEDPLPERRKRD